MYEKEQGLQAKVTAEQNAKEAEVKPSKDESAASNKKNRQGEEILGVPVVEKLITLYSEYSYGPDVDMAADVHNHRKGTKFENVIIMHLHWRSNKLVELIAVEAKVEFVTAVVGQASYYRGFAHRVSVAVPVHFDAKDAAVSII